MKNNKIEPNDSLKKVMDDIAARAEVEREKLAVFVAGGGNPDRFVKPPLGLSDEKMPANKIGTPGVSLSEVADRFKESNPEYPSKEELRNPAVDKPVSRLNESCPPKGASGFNHS